MGQTMQNVSVRKGNIFSSRCQTIVNTVNCVGIMVPVLRLNAACVIR